jgi:hypothetical protein
MKHYIFAIIFILFGFVACTEDLPERGNSPVMPENCQGVFFPATNMTTVELDPLEPKEMTISISRVNYANAIEVPLTVAVNTENIFEVPQKVAFAAGEETTQFVVKFPNADVGVTYQLSLIVKGDEFANEYFGKDAYVNTNVTRVQWEAFAGPIVMINAFWSQPPHYIPKAEIAAGSGNIANMIRLTNPFPTGGAPSSEPTPDEYGIYNGVPDIWEDEIVRDNVQIVITVDKADKALLIRGGIGAMWYDVEMEISMNGSAASGKANRDEKGKIVSIEFPEKDLFIVANSSNQGWSSGGILKIYLSFDEYLKDNMKIDDFNEPEYEDIIGAVSEFESKAYGESWDQSFAKAIDIDSENEKSEYKNLYYLADLYAEDFGLAFYYDGKVISIPANQPTGRNILHNDIFVSKSSDIASGVTTTSKGVTVYTLGLKFHFKDGTVLGEFAEVFYFSEEPVSYAITDFYGKYKLTAPSQFSGEPAANMNVTIAAGTAENTFVITGIDWAEAVEATFDVATSTLSIEPQTLPDYTYQGVPRDMTLYTTTADGDVGATAIMDFKFNMSGKLLMTSTSEADGYLIRSESLGGWVDGYYDIVFTPSAASPTPAKAKASVSKPLSVKNLNRALIKQAEKCSNDNFVIQSKTSRKAALKNTNATLIF